MILTEYFLKLQWKIALWEGYKHALLQLINNIVCCCVRTFKPIKAQYLKESSNC